MFIQACTLVANSMRATIEAFTNDVGQNTHKEVPRINANLVALPHFIFNSRIKSSGLLNNFKFLYIWNSLSSNFEAFANYVGQDTYITF